MLTNSRSRQDRSGRPAAAEPGRLPLGYGLRVFALMCPILLVACGPAGGLAPHAADGLPSASRPIAASPDGVTVWVVNPDADSVTSIATDSLEAGPEIAVGQEPWSIAVAPGGTVVVANRASGTLTFLDGTAREDLWVGAEPSAVALSPTGRLAYVALAGPDEVALVDVPKRELVGRVTVGAYPWSLAVTDDGDMSDRDETVVVAQRLALPTSTSDGADRRARITFLSADGRVMGNAELPPYGFGFANAIEGVTVSDGRVYAAHLLNAPALPRGFNTSVSAGMSSLSLPATFSTADLATASDSPPTGAEVPLALHLNDAGFSTPVNFPRDISIAPDGKTAYIVLSGSNAVMGIDISDPAAPRLVGFWPTGDNPRGMAIDPSGERAFVMNYLSRDVSVLDLTDTIERPETERVEVASETLSTAMLRGKTLFNNASDPRISRGGWISCASCHLDGGGDGTSWATPEGLRQTIPLWELAGTLPLHASATRDEVQDFESDIEEFMRGVGLAPGSHQPLLGEPNAGRSADLDALAEFVLNGFRVPRAPASDAPQLVATGRRLFSEAGCAACHGGPSFTSSTMPGPAGSSGDDVVVVSSLHDVGTFDPDHDLLGQRGFDPPTLRGVHATAPYLHDGSAATLEEVLRNEQHVGVRLDDGQVSALAAFLLTIDAGTEAVPLSISEP